MNTLLLERKLGRAWLGILERRTALTCVLERLEEWLPREEARLERARQQQRPDRDGEARWGELLLLYERLTRELAG